MSQKLSSAAVVIGALRANGQQTAECVGYSLSMNVIDIIYLRMPTYHRS